MIFFDGISILDIHSINWDIQYDRNNQTYRMLIAVCRFVIKGLLQTTADGSTKIMDYADDQTMAKLYEKFEIPTPNIDQQQSIIDKLAKLEKYVDVQGKELSLLSQMRNGLLQQLFI